MTADEKKAFNNWAWNSVGNDVDHGPIYDEHGTIGIGYNDVHEGETELNDRR